MAILYEEEQSAKSLSKSERSFGELASFNSRQYGLVYDSSQIATALASGV
jgi:hypothetical protein